MQVEGLLLNALRVLNVRDNIDELAHDVGEEAYTKEHDSHADALLKH